MELVEFGALSLREWIDLTGREREAFGAAGADLAWRPKDRHVGLRGRDGRLEAAAGAAIVTLEIGGATTLEVVGLGGLIIRKEARGRGLMTPLMDGLKRIAERMGPDRAVIFCERPLITLYERRGYDVIRAPVSVDQPGGRIEMPMAAMWRGLRVGSPEWPAGKVDVRGLPF